MADAREVGLLSAIEPREPSQDRWNAYVIADYGVGDLAFTEVAARLRAAHSGVSAEKVSVPPFSTIATGFALEQIGIHNAYPGMFLFSNTAPRGSEDAIKWQGDDRQRLLFAMLKVKSNAGEIRVPVLAVSAGYNWSFIKNNILRYEDGSAALYDLDIPNSGTQFRSRDIYPTALKRILDKDITVLGKQLNPNIIPDPPINRIAYKDGYGNIKTTTRLSQFPESLKQSPFLRVRIGSNTQVVYNSLSGKEAGLLDFSLNAGSSGGEEDPYLEIVKRGGSADYQFGAPVVYDDRDPIEFTSVDIS